MNELVIVIVKLLQGKYDLHSFVSSLLISSILRQEKEIVMYKHCALSELCFPF